MSDSRFEFQGQLNEMTGQAIDRLCNHPDLYGGEDELIRGVQTVMPYPDSVEPVFTNGPLLGASSLSITQIARLKDFGNQDASLIVSLKNGNSPYQPDVDFADQLDRNDYAIISGSDVLPTAVNIDRVPEASTGDRGTQLLRFRMFNLQANPETVFPLSESECDRLLVVTRTVLQGLDIFPVRLAVAQHHGMRMSDYLDNVRSGNFEPFTE